MLELKARGISTDQEDNYNGTLPYDLIPKVIQDILFNDNRYRDYLLSKRELVELLMTGSENVFSQNLHRTARVCEEDLLMWRTNKPSNSGVQHSTAASNIETTTDAISATLTSESLKRSNKGSYYVNFNGKHFAKKARTTFFDDCYECSDETTSSQFLNEFKDSFLEGPDNHYISNTPEKVFYQCSVTYNRFHKKQCN